MFSALVQPSFARRTSPSRDPPRDALVALGEPPPEDERRDEPHRGQSAELQHKLCLALGVDGYNAFVREYNEGKKGTGNRD